MTGHEFRPPALGQSGEDECSFCPGKTVANTHACSSTEWEIREFRPLTLRLKKPTTWIEDLRFLVVAGVAVDEVGTHKDCSPRRHNISSQLEFLKRSARNNITRGVEAQRFCKHRPSVLEVVDVFDCRYPAGEHCIQFMVKGSFTFRIL